MIRLATEADAAPILEIYRPSVERSSVSFETEVPTVDEMARRIAECLQTYPWIVEEHRGQLRGYAYAHRYHVRSAYRWAAQVSVYVAENSMRQGVAKRLYETLFALLETQGVRKALAAITVPNLPSQRFHESLGFEQVGVAQDVGFKLGAWQSMGWWQRPLGDGATSAPSELVAFQEIASQWQGDLTHLSD